MDRKDYILNKAFEVFMAKGYDSVSMTVLQKELNMSRGAMYRYFDSKDDLFKAVVDKYLFGLMGKFEPSLDENLTLMGKIQKTVQMYERIYTFIYKIRVDEKEGAIKFLNYTALMIQAAKRYPGFAEKVRMHEERVLNAWKLSIIKSIEKGEIRKDIEIGILARVFASAYKISEPSEGESRLKTAEDLENTMVYLYSLIKK